MKIIANNANPSESYPEISFDRSMTLEKQSINGNYPTTRVPNQSIAEQTLVDPNNYDCKFFK